MQKAALVLSGGGSLGMAHIGALRLIERKYEFDFCVGVSAGSIIAACYACGKLSPEIEKDITEQNFLHFLVDYSKSNFGFSRGQKMLDFLRKIFDDRTFEDLPKGKTLVIGATDFSNGERVFIRSGSIAEAVRASSSIPIVFEPFFYQNRWLVDGGLAQNFPLDVAIEEYKGKKIIGVDVASGINPEMDFEMQSTFGKMRHIHILAQRCFHIFCRNQQRHFPDDPRVTIIRPYVSDFAPLSFNRLKEIEERGEKAAKEVMKEL
jgi:NTE family protein